jgi:hypothetical protein
MRQAKWSLAPDAGKLAVSVMTGPSTPASPGRQSAVGYGQHAIALGPAARPLAEKSFPAVPSAPQQDAESLTGKALR